MGALAARKGGKKSRQREGSSIMKQLDKETATSLKYRFFIVAKHCMYFKENCVCC